MEHCNLYATNSPAELARGQEVLDRAVLYASKAQQPEHEGRFDMLFVNTSLHLASRVESAAKPRCRL